MQLNCLSLSSSPAFSLKPLSSHHHHHLPPPRILPRFQLASHSSSFNFNPLRLSLNHQKLMPKFNNRRSSGVVCYSHNAIINPRNLPWISAVSAAILMLVKGSTINRSFLVPLFALQAPASVISWMQGEYGAWSALLTLLVRLFFSIPGELELPFLTLVLVIVAPHRALNLRGTQAGAIISLVIAAYLAFRHFTGAGGLQKSFDQGSIVATVAIICITVVPCLLLI